MTMFGQSKTGPKPLASLSSTLLARKGQAKPAMRPQGFGGFGGLPGQQDDLGWNDMGETAEPAYEPEPVAPIPPVLVQREVLAGEFAEPADAAADLPHRELKPVSVATAARISRETAKKRGKAAFTLRLDGDRHLRLRLASALQGASAQTLVTEALDRLLLSLPEVEALVVQLPPRTKR